MPTKDLHEEPFDEGTIAKLELFADYAQEWIPTFVMQGFPVICIVDFFAGTGYDKLGVPGTAIRILQKVKEQVRNIKERKVRVLVHVNEFEPDHADQAKYHALVSSCEQFLVDNPDVRAVVEIKYHNEDFESLFPKLLSDVGRYPSLVFLDQNGIKFFSPHYISALAKTGQTDFLYFVSSSYFRRFASTKDFKKHLDIDVDEIRSPPYNFIHRTVLDALRNRLSSFPKLKLYPFTIRKPTGVYGIVFGASHPRAVEKFINRAWKRDQISGEANFDINQDLKKGQRNFFEAPTKTKIEVFQDRLRDKILSGELSDNFNVFEFAHKAAHPARHAADVLRDLRRRGYVSYEGASPLVSYDAVHGPNKRLLSYTVIKGNDE